MSRFAHVGLGPWVKGMGNVPRATRFPKDLLHDAVNVNVRQDGSAITRLAWELVLSGSAHSLFRHNDRVFAVFNHQVSELDSEGVTLLGVSAGHLNWSVLNDKPLFATNGAVYVIEGDAAARISDVERDEFDLEDELVPMPGGQWAEYWNGRVVVARGSSLLFSEPARYGVHNPMTGYIRLESYIEWVAPLESGIYVGLRDKVYFLAGTTPVQGEGFSGLRRVAVAGRSAPGMALVVEGHVFSESVGRAAIFLTPSGFAVGRGDGQVLYPQSQNVRNLPLFRGRLYEVGGRIYAVRGF